MQDAFTSQLLNVKKRVPLPSITDLPLSNKDQEIIRRMEPCQIISEVSIPAQKPKKVVKGSWSFSEDERLRTAVTEQNPILWDHVAAIVGGRTPKQCRERWQYRLHPKLNKDPFEPWEDEFIISERKKVGNHWTLIAARLPGRTSCSVKNRWYTVLRNRQIAVSECRFRPPKWQQHPAEPSGQ